MNSQSRILIVGDVHGAFGYLSALINKNQDRIDMVLCCGDFGYWPGDKSPRKLKNKRRDDSRIPVYFCDGNHEDHHALRARLDPSSPTAPVPVAREVYWMPRSSTLTLPDGRVICFLGGAKSIDKGFRREGDDWFPEEVLQPEDLENLPARADIVISHTAPKRLGFGRSRRSQYRPTGWESTPEGFDLTPDPTEKLLDEAWDRLQPSLWYFGHFHQFAEGELDGVRWMSLHMAGSQQKWWTWLL